jgi:hypothetical protein
LLAYVHADAVIFSEGRQNIANPIIPMFA